MSTAPLPADARPGRLIAFRADRLGARLVSLMNAMRLAEDLGADYACAWTDTTGVGHVFNDPAELFDAAWVDAHFLNADTWRRHRKTCEPLSGQIQQQPGRVAEELSAGRDLIVGNAFGVIALAGERPADIVPRFRSQFDQIPWAGPVEQAMAGLSDVLNEYTAYHIRRGDLTGDLKAMNKAWPHKMVPNEFYERHMARTLSSGGVILFSDDAATVDHYRDKFPSLRTLPDLVDTDGLTEAQRDLLELYAMSRCATIIAPERSAFSSTAADLTGARKLSVTDALTDDEREAAYRDLHARLLDRPQSFSGDGDIGQCLAHVGDWLEGQERWQDAAELFATRVRDGLNIAFVYPRAMAFQHRTGDAAGVVEIARHMHDRSIVHVKDQAAAEILHGYAHIRMGDPEAGLRHIVNGFWHAPSIPSAKSVVPFLIANHLLTPRNFLPASDLQLSLLVRRGPLKSLFVEFPELVGEGAVIPAALGAMEPVLWDWAPLMRSYSVTADVRRGLVARFAEALTKMPDDDDAERAERESLTTLFAAFQGDPEAAGDRLGEMADAHPDLPMLRQRQSHAYWLARRFGKAAVTAAAAAAVRPDWVALRAWAGQTALRVRDFDVARVHLDVAAEADVGLASIHALRSDCLERQREPVAALIEARRALSLAPLEVDHVLRAARLLDANGQWEDAVACMMPVVEAQRAPAKLFVQLVSLLRRAGQGGRADAIMAEARLRLPDHPALARLQTS